MATRPTLLDPYEPGISDRECWHRHAAAALSLVVEAHGLVRWCSLETTAPGMPDQRPILLTPALVHVLLPAYDALSPYDSVVFSGALGSIESPADAHVLPSGAVLRPESTDMMVIEAVPSTAGVNGGCGWAPEDISLLLQDYWAPRLGQVPFQYDAEHSRILREEVADQVGGDAVRDPEAYFTRDRDLAYGYAQPHE